MAYSIELEGRTIFLAAKAETPMGDYIVYEWNDGIFIPEDDEDWEYDDLDEDDDTDLELEDEYEEDLDDEDYDDFLDEEEDEVETAIREDIETIISAGFVPQGGVSALITPEYTTCYSQAFFRKK
ncbi:MAG: hypothetical protein MSS69_10215 [Spirochaetales bacterium]|nr:hypothetical protein [Spirochaetales bacterium]